jgi:hypothetical protein
MSKTFTFPAFSSYPEHAKVEQKLNELREAATQLAPELEQMEAKRLAFTSSRSKPEDQARALLAGTEKDAAPDCPSLEEITRLREREKILDLAVRIASDRLQELRGQLSHRICQDVRPQFAAAWQELAESLVLASERATELEGMYAQLDAAGVMRSTLPVAVPLELLDARNPDGRLNGWVDAIEKDYAVRVKRESLEKAEAERLKRHHETERRKSLAKAQEEATRAQRRAKALKSEA